MSVLGAARPLAYRRLASPLHAARGPVAGAYGGSLALSALLSEHPLVLGALLLAVLGAGACAGVGRQLTRFGALTALPIVTLSVLVNALVSRQGLTVFARLGDWLVLGQVNLTVEALVYGLVFGLRLLVVALACMLVVCAADPDELLLAFRRFSPSSALTVSLATRLIPVLGQDARRLAEAQRCRPDGGARSLRGRAALVRASVAGALDRALDVAAVLEMRGYGAPAGGRERHRARRSRHDLAFAASACGLTAMSLLAAASATDSFRAYPLLHVPVNAAVFGLCATLLLLALAPFADRRGIDP